MDQQLAAHIVIDGYNLLYRLDGVFGDCFEEGYPRQRARSALIERLTLLSRRFMQLQIDLWFDSRTATQEAITNRLRVHYSGGKGKNRADDQMIRMLREISTESTALLFVVSDDINLRGRCRALDIQAVECEDFKTWIEHSWESRQAG